MLNSFLCDFSCRKDPESKITSLLTEARRNREMCNQIAQKVLLNPSYMTKLAPVGPEVSIIEWECEWVTILLHDWMKKQREFLSQLFDIIENQLHAFRRHSNKTD